MQLMEAQLQEMVNEQQFASRVEDRRNWYEVID